jgi:hypothetical protein
MTQTSTLILQKFFPEFPGYVLSVLFDYLDVKQYDSEELDLAEDLVKREINFWYQETMKRIDKQEQLQITKIKEEFSELRKQVNKWNVSKETIVHQRRKELEDSSISLKSSACRRIPAYLNFKPVQWMRNNPSLFLSTPTRKSYKFPTLVQNNTLYDLVIEAYRSQDFDLRIRIKSTKKSCRDLILRKKESMENRFIVQLVVVTRDKIQKVDNIQIYPHFDFDILHSQSYPPGCLIEEMWLAPLDSDIKTCKVSCIRPYILFPVFQVSSDSSASVLINNMILLSKKVGKHRILSLSCLDTKHPQQPSCCYPLSSFPCIDDFASCTGNILTCSWAYFDSERLGKSELYVALMNESTKMLEIEKLSLIPFSEQKSNPKIVTTENIDSCLIVFGEIQTSKTTSLYSISLRPFVTPNKCVIEKYELEIYSNQKNSDFTIHKVNEPKLLDIVSPSSDYVLQTPMTYITHVCLYLNWIVLLGPTDLLIYNLSNGKFVQGCPYPKNSTRYSTMLALWIPNTKNQEEEGSSFVGHYLFVALGYDLFRLDLNRKQNPKSEFVKILTTFGFINRLHKHGDLFLVQVANIIEYYRICDLLSVPGIK